MTMRALVQRDQTVTNDAWGHPQAPSWTTLATYACRVWSSARRHVVDGNKDALVEDLRCAFPLGTDVTAADRISSVQDRRGTTLWAGPLEIQALQHKHTHLEAILRRVN